MTDRTADRESQSEPHRAPDPDAGARVGTELRQLRRRRGLTQAGVADALQVERPTISQWEAGRHLPSPARAQALDDLLDAGGELQRLIEQHRHRPSAPSAGRPPASPDHATSLRSLLRQAKVAIEAHLQHDPDGRPLGWCHNLNQRSAPTAVSTAYGIRALLLIDETSQTDLLRLGRRLHDMASDDGGWATQTQRQSSPEATALVVDALVRVNPTEPVGGLLDIVESELDDFSWRRPAILATILETVLDLRPESALADKLVRALLQSQLPVDGGGRRLWGEKNEPGLASPQPSVCHTARATALLVRARSIGVSSDLSGEVDEALGTGLDWLLGPRDLDNTSEYVDRTLSEQRSVFYMRHFTSSWVARALLLSGEPAHHPRVVAALDRVWASFSTAKSLWRWDNGDVPIWMSLDAIATLRLAALTAFPAPRPDH